MTRIRIGRRTLLVGAAGLAAAFGATRLPRSDAIDITWGDLVPEEDQGVRMNELRALGVVEHGQLSTQWDQEASVAISTEYDGAVVRLPGYTVPLDFAPDGMTEFLLVPYVGACIHVPPPPPNQLVFVTTEQPFASEGMFVPVEVTGVLSASATETGLAEIGYSLAAQSVRRYDG